MNNVKHLRRLVYFVKPYWTESLFALILLMSVVLMDLAIPRLVQRIIDEGIEPNNLQVIISTSLIMLGIAALSTLFAIGNNIFSVRVGEGFARDLRETLFLKIQSFSFGDLDRTRTGQLMVRLTSDISIVQRVIRMSLRIGTRAPLLMIGSFVLMLLTDVQLTLTLFPLLLITGVVIGYFVTKLGPLFLVVQRKLDRLNSVLQENIAGVRVVKAFVRAPYENDRFAIANQDFTDENVNVMQIMALVFPVMLAFINLGIVLVVWSGGLQVIDGTLSVGEIIAFTNYLLTAMSPLVIMAHLSMILAGGNASAERIYELLDTTPEVQDVPDNPRLPESVLGRVIFENVGFHYHGASDEPVLCDINLVVEPGETIAILGATGSGKTTFVNLIPRFYDVTSGSVKIDGVDVRDIPQDSLLAQIGVALQETVLFSGSVRDNIRYGRPDASDEDVIAAARAAQAHDFILELSNGYYTRIEQRGVNLSGGQKQRIAIARAILSRPKILILDDSTSSVDVMTETKIQAALDELMQDCTSFIVAQRISTVLNADMIVLIEKGRIVAQGTHADLKNSSPIYQEIYDSQLGEGLQITEMIGD
jgi:ATP-binding cassette subfamily B protein